MKNFKLKNKQGGWIGALIGGAAILGGSAISAKGQSGANKKNLKIAREQMAFQERMSGTAFQRATKDLESSGLNRILAIGQPATTPAGQTATMQNPQAPIGEGISRGVNSAIAIRTMKANIENINARTELTIAQKNAISPAAEIGEGIGEIVVKSKNMASRAMQEIKLGPPKARATLTPSIQKRHNLDRLNKIATSLGLDPRKAQVQLAQLLDEMDFPRQWTNQQKLDWAFENQAAVKRYLQRRK